MRTLVQVLGCVLLLMVGGAAQGAPEPDLVSLADPFVGTGGHGHTFPGATVPFGMVQVSPDTRLEGWDGCSAYHYSDEHIYGFSHTHLSGTGCSDYGDILLMPSMGEVRTHNGADGKPGYRSRFEHAREWAEPGYYAVDLLEHGIKAEVTATPRVGVHRYTFPAGAAHVLVDLRHRDTLIDAAMAVHGTNEIRGFRRSRAWSQDQRVYFVARFSKPFASADLGTKEEPVGAVHFDLEAGETLTVHVGISAVDVEGALRNLDQEAAELGFDTARNRARKAWQRQLAKIVVEGGTEAQRRTFYSALYHTSIAPNLFTDVDGRYRGTDLRVHTATDHIQYTVFSLWDTFRALHPLYTITERARTRDFVRSMLAHYQDGESLPVWELWGWYTGCMIGYHSVSVIADAWAKGIRDFDAKLALEAMQHSANKDIRGLPSYRELGFVAAEQAGESVSRTLEYAYDDWCIATFAKATGHEDVAERFFERAGQWRNVFDPTTGFMRAKRNHQWVGPFKPAEVNTHYTEANAWQYSLFVPHDTNALMEALGGPKALEAWLDRLFTVSSQTSGREQADITGLIGQYAHGNEPSHHMAYLYAYAGVPAKTQARVREICDTLYSDRPDGYCGNEDCGQMSAWYVFSALGFYPVVPGAPEYVIGSPLFPRASIRLENGKVFRVEAKDVSTANTFVQRVWLNGKPHDTAVLTHDAIMAGGELVLEMGPAPSSWGTDPSVWPKARGSDPAFLPVPFVAEGERVFSGETRVAFATLAQDARLFVSQDGDTFAPYTQPLVVNETTTLHAYAERDGRRSKTIAPTFTKRRESWSIALTHMYANQYAATGPGALLDGLRGGPDWHTGDWQGFHGVDLVATIDLGGVRDVDGVYGHFLQEQRSWIWLPKSVEVSVSLDGAAWRPLGRAMHTLDPKHDGTALVSLGVAIAARARFVRLTARSVGTCPAWHPGAGEKAWIFADEIEVSTR